MKYFKNSELARYYGISEKTVRNWIIAAKEGKNQIELYVDEKNRAYIAETMRNDIFIKSFIEEGKKYRNSRTHRIITVRDEFYATYSSRQQAEIFHNLDKNLELPYEYSHMGRGVEYNDSYYQRIWNEGGSNSQFFSVSSLARHQQAISEYLTSANFNIVEIGGRTGRLASEILDIFSGINVYCDVDISFDMAQKTQANLRERLGDRPFQIYQRNIFTQTIEDILFDLSVTGNNNLVLLLGGTLLNSPSPVHTLQNISKSLGSSDLFITTAKLDSEDARRYFDFNPKPENRILARMQEFAVDLLGLESDMYDVEQIYDAEEKVRKNQIKLKFDISLNFEFNGNKGVIEFRKGDAICIWRYWHQTLEEFSAMVSEAGFKVMQATQSPDEQFGMIIARPRTARSAILD